MSEKKPLAQLAAEHGQRVHDPEQNSPYGWKHRVADTIHGWSQHEYHYQADPVMLTDETYLAALHSAAGSNVPHEPAVATPPSAAELARRIEENAARLKVLRDEKNRAQPLSGKVEADDSAQ